MTGSSCSTVFHIRCVVRWPSPAPRDHAAPSTVVCGGFYMAKSPPKITNMQNHTALRNCRRDTCQHSRRYVVTAQLGTHMMGNRHEAGIGGHTSTPQICIFANMECAKGEMHPP